MKTKKVIHCDMDGIVADFQRGYKEMFFRDALKDDSFTISQNCLQVPYFFRILPVIEKGRLLVELLTENGYKVVFLTTPMAGMDTCRRDKLEWTFSNFGPEYDVIFSDNKSNYVEDESSILIDDMDYNLKPWKEKGGTAIDFNKNSIDKIFEIIEEAIHGKKEIAAVKEQLKNIDVELKPSEAQKESGNYKKGRIKFKKLDIAIENTPGSIRFGWDEAGRKWVSRLNSYYGYITSGADGNDGDKVDCYIGPKYNKNLAFVINQMTADNLFDEHKIILGCESVDEALALYLGNYQKGWESRIGSIVPTNTKQLRTWLNEGNLNEPFK